MVTLEQLERATPALSGFTERYHKEVRPALIKHQRRLKSGTELVVLGLVFVIPGVVLAKLDGTVPLWASVLGYVVLFPGSGLFLWGVSELFAARTAAKVLLATKVCEVLGFRYRLSPPKTYTKWFYKVALLPEHETYDAQDEVSGTVEGIDFIFQEVELKARQIGLDRHGLPERRLETVFQGLIGLIDFHKRFSSTTVAVPRQGLWKAFSTSPLPGERARLESPRFEARYDVYSTDQVEARYLLTPTFMERIMNLDAFFKGNLEFAFDQGRFLFAAAHQDDWMELRGGHDNLADEGYAMHIILDATLIYHLIAALKLDAKTKA